MKHIKTYEGLFDFFRKKPIESPSPMVDILYEPIEARYMTEYEENHKTVPFTKSESDYIKGLVKKPTDVVYNRIGQLPNFTVDHYRVKINHKEFIIRKYDDEWFLVTLYDSKSNYHNLYKYYKCDTFDGVKQLLDRA
jgi:signal peptidase I